MSVEKSIKKRICYALFGWIFALLAIFAPIAASTPVFAEPESEPETSETTEPEEETEPETPAETSETTETNQTLISDFNGDVCKESLGSVGWLVCPTMNVVTSATDSLYTVIKEILVIKPLESNDNSPIYIIWKYCLGISNIVFVLFLLVVVFSQITGVGISNYGIKRILPKLIIAAIMINLSFLVCTLAVDISNIVGESLRSIFESVPITIGDLPVSQISKKDIAGFVLGTTAIAGVTIAASAASLWMLIPTLLAGLASVVSGLITIALRQTVVTLLVMISPLAFVCNMLPNTKDLYSKWKNLFKKMLVFYPLFSLLFGASSLAGWAIIASASSNPTTGMFMVVLGLGVQIMPLFFSWSLMKMSGTFLGEINAKIRSLADKPLATNRAWAESHRENSRARKLALDKSRTTPSARLMQYLSDRKISRESDTKEYNNLAVTRGLVYNANKHYDKNGRFTKDGEEAYEMQTQNILYQSRLLRDKNFFQSGVAVLARDNAHRKRLEQLDNEAVNAADEYAMQASHAAVIDYNNAVSRQNRFNDAMNAHIDEVNSGKSDYRRHIIMDRTEALRRYEQMRNTMKFESSPDFGINYIAADAASTFSAQTAIMQGKFEKYNNAIVPTNDIIKRLEELSKSADSSKNIDAIIGGMKILNMRGDTSLIAKTIQEICADNKLELGTYASQALSSFLMFDVKDKDPTLRRFGKYINLETAKIYNDNEAIDGTDSGRRLKLSVDMDEYIRGEYIDHQFTDANGAVHNVSKKSKLGIAQLVTGTSFSGAEREAYDVFEKTIASAYVSTDAQGNRTFDTKGWLKKRAEAWNAALPNIVSDQFAYLSGSEQIMALSRVVAGDPLASLSADVRAAMSEEDKKAAKEAQGKRVDDFVHAQVYNQIARTKSDMLSPIKKFYVDKAAEEYADDDSIRNATDEERQKYFEKKAADLFKANLQPGIYDSLLDNARKGNLPDTKSGLVEFLDLLNKDEQMRVRNERYPKDDNGKGKKKGSRREDDDEDGGYYDTTRGVAGAGLDGQILGNELDKIRRRAQTENTAITSPADIRRHYDEQMSIINNDATVSSAKKMEIQNQIGRNLGGYTSYSQLDEAIDNMLNS